MRFSGPSCVCAVTKRICSLRRTEKKINPFLKRIGLSPRYNFSCNCRMGWAGRDCKDQFVPTLCCGYKSLPGVVTRGIHSEFVQ